MKFFLKIIIFSTILCTGFFSWVWLYGISPLPTELTSKTITIPANIGFKEIHTILVTQAGLKRDIRFRLLAGMIGVSQRLQAGEYEISAGETPLTILRKFEAGSIIRHPVTIPEGENIYTIAAILSEDNWINRDRFLTLVKNPDFIKKTGLTAASLEGYLFPDTYHLARNQSPQSIILMMIKRLEEVYAEISALEPTKHSFTKHEILTLASIIEKETGQENERPRIAMVFLNRLHKGMKLQADPTVIYGIQNFNGNLTSKDLATPTPYNTYRTKGLPPGPICNPGRGSIEAAIRQANKISRGGNEGYLYFVSMNDGTHYFSKTLAEHNKAVMKYQKRKKVR